jgi:hypothetical protein
MHLSLFLFMAYVFNFYQTCSLFKSISKKMDDTYRDCSKITDEYEEKLMQMKGANEYSRMGFCNSRSH